MSFPFFLNRRVFSFMHPIRPSGQTICRGEAMELVIFAAAFLSFFAGAPAHALLLRCGLCAFFSARTTLALASIASLCGASAFILRRQSWRAAAAGVAFHAALLGFVGGTASRAAVLMVCARFTGSRYLLAIHAPWLVCLSLLALYPASMRRGVRSKGALWTLLFLCSAAEGFFGAGGVVLYRIFAPHRRLRSEHVPASPALIVVFFAQLGALMLTHFSGAAQILPGTMLLALISGTSLGALSAKKQRGAFLVGLRFALLAYLVFSALSLMEQAFLSP